MIEQLIPAAVALFGGGGAVGFVLNRKINKRKLNAEASLAEEEVADKSWGRFQKEIERIDRSLLECEKDKEVLRVQQAQLTNEIQLMRHRVNNEVHSTEVLLMIIESHAETLPSAVNLAIVKVKELRAQQAAAIAVERLGVAEGRLHSEAGSGSPDVG